MTFPTGVVEIRNYSDEELKTMLDKAREASKHSRKLGGVMGIVTAHRLHQMKDLLTFEKLATWRRMKGFYRVADGEDSWLQGPRSLSPTPEDYATDSWCKVNDLKSAISMPAKSRPWQKAMDFVDGLKGKLPDEELAVIKRYVEKRSREAAQAQVTLRRLIPYSTVAPAHKLPNLRQMYVSSWRTTREGWTRSEASSNHHRLVRVLKRPDSSAPRTRGRGRKDEPSLTAIRLLVWDRTKGETFLHPRRNAWTREPSELRRT